jgi:RuvA, C-terminal domain
VFRKEIDFDLVPSPETPSVRQRRARKFAWYAEIMSELSLVSDTELLARMPWLVNKERGATSEVIAHLIEIDRRRLYVDESSSSLTSYCIERLGYSEDAASKRVRVARLAGRFPGVLDELRSGAIHLTGLCLLAQYLTPESYETLVPAARGKTRHKIEELLAAHFPKPDVPDRIVSVPEQTSAPSLIRPGTDPAPVSRVEPRSASSFAVQFTASVELALAVWDRDGGQCTHVDAQGRRCSARRYLTLEHRDPYARGGPPTLDNLCLLCKAHNLASARKVFGDAYIERRRVLAKVHAALRNMGFREQEARRALGELEKGDIAPEPETLLRAALAMLTPAAIAR